MYTNGSFQYALARLYREYLTTIGPCRVKEFLAAHDGRGNGGQPPDAELIAAGVDVFSSAASAEYFLRRAAAREETAAWK